MICKVEKEAVKVTAGIYRLPLGGHQQKSPATFLLPTRFSLIFLTERLLQDRS